MINSIFINTDMLNLIVFLGDIYIFSFLIFQLIIIVTLLSSNKTKLSFFSTKGGIISFDSTGDIKTLRVVLLTALGVLVVSAVLVFMAFLTKFYFIGPVDHVFQLFNDSLVVDYSIISCKFFLILVMLVFTFYCYAVAGNASFLTLETYALTWIVFFGGLMLLSANNFLVIFLALELVSIPLYILVGSVSRNNYSTEAGLKYLIIGAISSSFILLGLALIYNITGVSSLQDLAFFSSEPNALGLLSDTPGKDLYYVPVIELVRYPHEQIMNTFFAHFKTILFLGWLFIFVGFLMKMGVAPFHFWMPDVYVGAPSLITMFLMTVQKFIMWVFFYKLFTFVFPWALFGTEFFYLFNGVIVLNIVLGIFPALYQEKFKKLLVYSSIGVNSLLVLPIVGSYDSYTTFILFLLVYILNTFGLFAFFFQLRLPNGTYLNKLVLYKELYNVLPVLSLAVSFVLMSAAGLPPTVGFISKFLIYSDSFANNFFAVLVILLGATAMSFYYFRLIRFLMVNDNKLNAVSLNNVLLVAEPKARILLTYALVYISLILILALFYFKQVIILLNLFFDSSSFPDNMSL